jgi:sporulation protein YlmC with PRC-barrel domain
MRVWKATSFAACVLACLAAQAAQTQSADQATPSGAVVRSSDLSGLVVYNPNNERLGKIEDLVIDPAAGKIRYAVLSFGGVFGFGDKYFAIPWQNMSFVAKGQTSAGTQKESHCVLNVDKDALKDAPGFDKEHWPDFADSDLQQKIDDYYRARAALRGHSQTR